MHRKVYFYLVLLFNLKSLYVYPGDGKFEFAIRRNPWWGDINSSKKMFNMHVCRLKKN